MKDKFLESLGCYNQTPEERALRNEYLKPEEKQDKELIANLEQKIDELIDHLVEEES